MRYLGIAAAAVLLLSAAACGDENDADAMRDTYKSSLAAVNNNDGAKSYELLSKACRDSISKEQWANQIERANAALGKGKLEVDTFEVVAQRGTEATVRSNARAKDAPPDLSIPSAPREYRMLKEGGDWRLDDCGR